MRRLADRRSPPRRRGGGGAGDCRAWCESVTSTRPPMRTSSESHSRRSSKIVSWTRLAAARPAEEHAGGRLEIRGEPRVGRRLHVAGARTPRRRRARTSIRSRPQVTSTPTRIRASMNAPSSSHGAPSRVTSPAGHRGGNDERAGLDAIGDDAVLGAPQAASALDLDRVGRGALDRGPHLLRGTR